MGCSGNDDALDPCHGRPFRDVRRYELERASRGVCLDEPPDVMTAVGAGSRRRALPQRADKALERREDRSALSGFMSVMDDEIGHLIIVLAWPRGHHPATP